MECGGDAAQDAAWGIIIGDVRDLCNLKIAFRGSGSGSGSGPRYPNGWDNAKFNGDGRHRTFI